MTPRESETNKPQEKSAAGQPDTAKLHGSDSKQSDSVRLRMDRARAAERVGTKLGKYLLTGILGQGGMGVVYRAHDPMVDREVAIKVLPADLAHDDMAVERFLLEARTAGKLNHPNTVTVYDVGQDGDTYFLVLELVPGGTVEGRSKIGKLPWIEATHLIADACKGLVAAHEMGLVHRDIKPSNLLIAGDGSVKISDFGLAKLVGDIRSGLSVAGLVIGTPFFMSPEQCEGSMMDGRSDLYSLGATYYRLLTGKRPYDHTESTIQVMYAQCHNPPPDPREIAKEIPVECRTIVIRSMAKRPSERYQSAREMLSDLQAVLRSSGDEGYSSRSTMIATTPEMGELPSQEPTKVLDRPSLGGRAPAGVWSGLSAALAAAGQTLRGVFTGPASAPVDDRTTSVVRPAITATIRVGVLHSLSGTMALSETPVVDAIMLAIGEINDGGGLLGRRVEAIVVDGQSDSPTFKREAERLIREEHVCTIFGCWTSASRKTVRPVFEELDHLLIYPVQYEGLELSPNIIYTGAAPNQQLLPALTWCLQTKGFKRFFLVGSDYVFPRSANAIMSDELKANAAEIVGEAYIPLASTQVRSVVDQIVAAKPDVILNTINGDSNVAFFRELRAAGITPLTVPTISFSIAEQELRSMHIRDLVGDYAVWNYFQSIDRDENKRFLKGFQAKYPTRAATDPMEAAYVGVRLWAQAVRECGSDDVKVIRKAMRNQSLEAPEGRVRIDPETQHLWKTARIGEIQSNGQFKIVWESGEPIAPLPYPKSRRPEEWKAFLQGLQNDWDGQWSAPAK